MTFNYIKRYIKNEIWRVAPWEVLYRKNDPCAYCGHAADTWDHMIAVSDSGRRKAAENLTRACQRCNQDKRSLSPVIYLACKMNKYKKGSRGYKTPRSPKVVHVKKESCDVYVGRGMGSKWGNPYSHDPDSKAQFIVATREEAIEKYKEYLYNHPTLLGDIHELKGKVLGCWCAPLPCHADILLQLANEEIVDVSV